MKRLPTKEEFEALLKLPHYLDKDRKVLVVNASNGNVLFFGYLFSKIERNVSTTGYYWSSTIDDYGYSYFLSISDFCVGIADINGYYCHSVRLVSEEPCDGFVDMGTGVYWSTENYREGEKEYFTWDEAMKIQNKVNISAVKCSYPNYNLLNLNQNSSPACTHIPEENLSTISENNPIDWEQRRYEIAKDALCGLLANHNFSGITTHAARAVKYADEIIKQLKQENNENN